MSILRKFLLLLVVVSLLFSYNIMSAEASSKNYLPFENSELGRNSNAYIPTYYPSFDERKRFVEEISVYAKEANASWGIPASAMIGMAAIESGYGATRIAVNANNIFGIKIWGTNPDRGWQLKGQPDENNGKVPILANYGEDRLVFDEGKRVDNWYRMFSSRKEAVDYLAGTLLLNQRYGFAKTNYENNLKKGWSYERASKQYIYEIAVAGYNHLGGDYYQNIVGNIMSEWDLYKYDQKTFKDIQGHWAQKEITYLAEKGWIDGYEDGTYKPNNKLTRVQSAKIISNFLELEEVSSSVHFTDVPISHWGHRYTDLVAQHNLMKGTGGERFSPNANLTRAQMAQIIYNAGLYTHSAVGSANPYKDVHKGYWAYPAIAAIRQDGIMAGYGDGRFGANDSITRAQMAAIIYRLEANFFKKVTTFNAN